MDFNIQDYLSVILLFSFYGLFIAGFLCSIVLFFRLLPLPYRFRNLKKNHDTRVVAVATVMGLLVGLLIRLLQFSHYSDLEVMSFSFIILTPMVVGAVSILFLAKSEFLSLKRAITIPWQPASLCLGATLLLAWEGIICTILFLPLFMGLASLGGALAYFCIRQFNLETRGMQSICSLLLLVSPFAVHQFEKRIAPETKITHVRNTITLAASPREIWPEIREVRTIQKEELPRSLSSLMGFPRPIEASLAGYGVGAVRTATFAGNLVFTERVIAWEEERLIRFSTEANTDEIPPTTLDEHVTIGGPYFDMLEGEYLLERHEDGKTSVHLSSSFRLATHFNWYSTLWARIIMYDIQNTILRVLERRLTSN